MYLFEFFSHLVAALVHFRCIGMNFADDWRVTIVGGASRLSNSGMGAHIVEISGEFQEK